jgi:putative DNA primase/helicase
LLNIDSLKPQVLELEPGMSQRFADNAGEGRGDFGPKDLNSGYDSGPFDMEAYILRHGFSVKFQEAWQGGTSFALNACPFNPDHQNGDARLILQADGTPGFKCFHNSCTGKGIKDLFGQYPPRSAVMVIRPDPSEIVSYGAKVASKFEYTDVGNARLFVDWYGPIVKYVVEQKQWLLWSDDPDSKGRWVPDRLLTATGLGMQFTERLIKKAFEMGLGDGITDSNKKKMYAHALRSQQQPRLEAMLKLARSQVAVNTEDLNKDPYLLNCLNGTIDLREGKLRAFDKADLITKQVPIEFDPEAVYEEWNTFLQTAMCKRQSLVDFLQRAAGYSLTGITKEECFFYQHGPSGSNGKGTFTGGIEMITGPYGLTADFSTFQQSSFSKGGSAPTPDIARLAGARFVHAAEPDEGAQGAQLKLNTGLLKNLTGRDKITARMLHGQPFEFVPQFKIWLQSNGTLVIADEDEATWRRVHRIPFDHQFKPADPEVKLRLTNPNIAGPGVLAWAVRGCLEWQKHGLKPPDLVIKSVESYKQSMDPLKEFYELACIFGPAEKVKSKAMHDAYLRWCDLPPRVADWDRMSQKKLSTRLVKFKGCKSVDAEGGAELHGASLKQFKDWC